MNDGVGWRIRHCPLHAAAPALLAACKAMGSPQNGGKIPWVHNAGITDNLDMLHAIVEAFADVWNNEMLPAINKAKGDGE